MWNKGYLVRSVIVILAALLMAACGGDETDAAVPVSIVRLMVDPGELSGKRIQVTGYLQKNPTLRLFLSKDHGTSRDIQSSVIVSDDSPDGSLTQSDCLNQYVQVTGTFDLLMGAAWAIVGIEDVMRVDTVETCWQR